VAQLGTYDYQFLLQF